MAQTRSPRYPNVSLQDAISRARMIYEREHMSPLTPEVAAEAMGYSSLNGASLKMISSLKKYGLLEGRGDDVRLTREAQTLVIDDPESEEYRIAIMSTALKPDVFLEIHSQFENSGSERNIAVYLEKQGFKPKAASNVASNYKETMALVSSRDALYDEEGVDSGPESEGGNMVSVSSPATESRRGLVPSTTRDVAGLASLSGLSDSLKSSGAPFQVVQNGIHLDIVASVDLKGLRKLKRVLDNYQNLLEMLMEDEADEDSEGDTTRYGSTEDETPKLLSSPEVDSRD